MFIWCVNNGTLLTIKLYLKHYYCRRTYFKFKQAKEQSLRRQQITYAKYNCCFKILTIYKYIYIQTYI